MSINTAHAFNGNGVVLFNGERILLYTKNVRLGFTDINSSVFKGEKKGKIFLTTHRIIFINSDNTDELKSFSIPFMCMREMELEQPVFGANHIKGKVLAEANGNWVGSVKFKLWFYSGGAIEFGQAMMHAGKAALRNSRAPPPAYTYTGDVFQAPPPAYSLCCADPNYGWLPYTVFPSAPPGDEVYMTNAPPPYPGVMATAPPMYSEPNKASTTQVPAAYYDPNNPHTAYAAQNGNPDEPPPAYGDVSLAERKRL